MAAMALSPLAALALPLVQDVRWKESLADFRDELRCVLVAKLQLGRKPNPKSNGCEYCRSHEISIAAGLEPHA